MAVPRCSLLVVDDEPQILVALSALLEKDFDVLAAGNAEQAREMFRQHDVHIVLTDQRMPMTTGVQLLEWVRHHSPRTIRLLMTGNGELEEAVAAINRGQIYHYLLKPWHSNELKQVLRNAAEKFCLERNQEKLLQELSQLNQALEERVRERTRALEEANHLLQQRSRELETLALTDPLTGLLNRRAIDDVVKAELRRHARYRGPLALGVVDADHFREINRQHLLPGGDQVLVHLAKILSGSLRTVDTVGRIGGEEFLIVAPETTLDGAAALAERIRSNVESSPPTYKGVIIPLTVSSGFAVAEVGTATNYEQLKQAASAALEQAKRKGRNCSVIHELQAPLEAVG